MQSEMLKISKLKKMVKYDVCHIFYTIILAPLLSKSKTYCNRSTQATNQNANSEIFKNAYTHLFQKCS